MKDVEITLRDRLASLITGMGYEFVGHELQRQGKNALLRIYLDKENGVTVTDCTAVSRQVSAMMDVEDPIKGRYILEVSSPGLDRPLYEIGHYQRFIGSKIKIRLYSPLNDRRNFVGILQRVEEANIHLLVDETEMVIPFSSIDKAKLVSDLVG